MKEYNRCEDFNCSCTSWGRIYAHKICSMASEKVIQNQKLWWINFRDGVLEIILAMYASRITKLHSLYPNVAIYYTKCNRMSKVLSFSSAPHHTIMNIFNWWANSKTTGTNQYKIEHNSLSFWKTPPPLIPYFGE